MKSIIKSALFFAVAAMAFSACTKNVEEQEPEIVNEIAKIQFSAVVNEAETRATLTPNTEETAFAAAWEVGDEMAIEALSTDADYMEDGTATWNGSYFETDLPGNETRGEWTYSGYYPAKKDIDFGSNRVQTGSVFNSAYDIMKGDVTYQNALLGKDPDGGNMVIPMNRLTSILYFHLTSDLNEPLTSATLTVEGGDIAGTAEINNGAIEFGGDASNTITITFAENSAPSANDFCLWFNILPVNATSLTLTVTTASKTATLTNSRGKYYQAGKLNKIVKSGLTWDEGDKYYVKVTSNENITDGKYLIVYETGSVAFDGGLETLDAVSNTIDVQIADNQILADEVTDAAYFEIVNTQSGSTIKSASGYYIGIDSYKNGLLADKSIERKNDIAIDENGNADITVSISANNIMKLRYNKTSDQTRFRYFTSEQQSIALYRYNGDYTVKKSAELSFNETEFTAQVGESFTAPTLVNPYNVSVTWSSSDNDIAAVDSDGTVTIGTKTGTVTITANFEGDDTYNAGSAWYTITVTAAARTLASITEPETGVTIEGVTAMAVSGSNVVIKDESGLFLLYKSSHGLKVGDKFDLTGDVTLYSDNNILEFTANITISNKTTSTAEPGTATEFDSIAEGLETDTKVTYVHAKGLQDGRNITTPGENVLRLSAANDATDGLNVEISGYTIGYSSTYSNHTIIATEIGVDPDIAELSVDVDELSWLYNETDAKSVNVIVNANGGFTYSTTDMDWATITVDGNVITVTPNGQNNNATPNSGTIVLTHSVDNTKTAEITCEQGEFVNLVSAVATFTPAASGGMSTEAGPQTGVRRNVTATISKGILNASNIAIYKSETLTLAVPSGAKITRIEFTCTSDNPISGFADVTGLVKDGDDGVWTGSEESITFTASGKQVRATAITVTYSIEESQLAKYAPVINASDKSVYVEESVDIDATADSEGTISYSIVSGENYITLNTISGEVTGVAEGTAVVKVSVAANGDYEAGSKNINIQVSTKPDGGDVPDPEEIVMSSQGFDNAEGVSSITGDNFDLTFTDGSTATAYYNTGSGVRIYGGGSVTVTTKNNLKISKIEFTYSAASNAPNSDYTVSAGSLTTGVNSTWTGTATNNVTVTRKSGSGHWRLQKVKVTFVK